jgi:hypothetical protein
MEARHRAVVDQKEPHAVRFGTRTPGNRGARFVSARQRRRGPEGLRRERKSNHPWAVAGRAVVKANRCVSIRTRPVSWLEPETSGVHPHTKGARCSAGGHRHRIPSTSSGLLTSRRLAGQDVRRPLVRRRKHLDQWTRDEHDPERNNLLVPQPAMGLQNAHTVAEGNARWGVPRGAGGLPRRRRQPAWQRETWTSGRLGRPTSRGWRSGLACRGVDRLRAPAVRIATA